MKRINLIRTFGAMSVLGITSVALSTSLTSCNKNDVYLTDLKVGDNLSGKTLKFNTKNTNNFTYDSQVMDSDTYIVELGGDSLVPTSRIYVQFVGGPGEENASVFVITLKGAVIYPCLMSSETNTIN
jgi:hypothetical protein